MKYMYEFCTVLVLVIEQSKFQGSLQKDLFNLSPPHY